MPAYFPEAATVWAAISVILLIAMLAMLHHARRRGTDLRQAAAAASANADAAAAAQAKAETDTEVATAATAAAVGAAAEAAERATAAEVAAETSATLLAAAQAEIANYRELLEHAEEEAERNREALESLRFRHGIPSGISLLQEARSGPCIVLYIRPRGRRHYLNGVDGLQTLHQDFVSLSEAVKTDLATEGMKVQAARFGPGDLAFVVTADHVTLASKLQNVIKSSYGQAESLLMRCSMGYTDEGILNEDLSFEYLLFHAEAAARQQIGAVAYARNTWLRRAALRRNAAGNFFDKDYDQVRLAAQGDLQRLKPLLQVFFQPKYRLVNGETNIFRLAGAEALLRFQNMASPLPVVAVLTDAGWLHDVTCTVVLPAITALLRSRSPNESSPPFRVSFNVRPEDLSDANCRQLLELMSVAEQLNQFEVEILEEGVYSTSTLDAVQLLQKNLVAVSLDDFGDANANLDRLLQIKADKVKLDRRIVRYALDKHRDAFLRQLVLTIDSPDIRNLPTVGHPVSRIVAEGAETDDDVRRLVKAGITEIQGFRFSRPVPPADFANLPMHVSIP